MPLDVSARNPSAFRTTGICCRTTGKSCRTTGKCCRYHRHLLPQPPATDAAYQYIDQTIGTDHQTTPTLQPCRARCRALRKKAAKRRR